MAARGQGRRTTPQRAVTVADQRPVTSVRAETAYPISVASARVRVAAIAAHFRTMESLRYRPNLTDAEFLAISFRCHLYLADGAARTAYPPTQETLPNPLPTGTSTRCGTGVLRCPPALTLRPSSPSTNPDVEWDNSAGPFSELFGASNGDTRAFGTASPPSLGDVGHMEEPVEAQRTPGRRVERDSPPDVTPRMAELVEPVACEFVIT